MAASIKIRSQRLDDYTEIKVLLSHPMENGRNRDVTGVLIPAHFIRELIIELNGKTVITTHLGGSVSKNPFFTFQLKNVNSGQPLTVRWMDNLGLSDSAEHIVE